MNVECERIQPLVSGYIDDELGEADRSRVEAHLEECNQCRQDLANLKEMKEVMRSMKFPEPTDRQLETYWRSIYNRMERSLGWVLFSVGAICLLSYGGFILIREVLIASEVPLVVKIGLSGMVFGLIVLLVSIGRERLRVRKVDRYSKEVER